MEKTTISDQRGQALKSDVHIVCEKAEAFIPLASLVDLDKERERIDKEIERVKGEIARAQSKLSNEKFVSRAPEAVVNEERRKLQAGEDMLKKLQERREALTEEQGFTRRISASLRVRRYGLRNRTIFQKSY